MGIELYPHNKTTYTNIVSMFETENRVGVIQPTGTGKSFLYLKWIEDYPRDNFVILSSYTAIFNQLRRYAGNAGIPELLERQQMLSYQALLNMSEDDVNELRPDKIILDEFHRIGAEQWGPAVQRLLDANPQAKVLGGTATPIRYLDNARDMSFELFGENIARQMSVGEAVQRQILPAPKYIPAWYDVEGKMLSYASSIAEVKDRTERKSLEEKLYQIRHQIESAYGAADVFKKHMPDDHGKYIVFCRDREHLEEMKQTMSVWLADINANIHTYVSISALEDKEEQILSFEADKSEDAIKLLFSIDRLSEGLHVEDIDGVIMLRPTISPGVYLQQMGRALASHKNKSPLIFDMVNNFENVRILLKNGSTMNVFEKEFRDAMDPNEDPASFQIFDDMIAFSSLCRTLEVTLYPSFNDVWEDKFELLKQFKIEFQRFPLSKEQYRGVNLGSWCAVQKWQAREPFFPKDRLEKLNTIGLLDDTYENRWKTMYALLTKFVQDFGRFPMAQEVYEGEKIGVWCTNQKQEVKKPGYRADRREQLEAIGFLNDGMKSRWESNFQLLEQFVSEYGRFPKRAEIYYGVTLGRWCNAQIQNAKDPAFPETKLNKLKEIGLLANTQVNRWETMFTLLTKFVQAYGRFPLSNEKFEDKRIGVWYQKQKSYIKNPSFPADRAEKLKSIGVHLDNREHNWNTNFEMLERFIKKYSRLPGYSDVYEGVKIGIWCHFQKQQFQKPSYPAERLQKLVTIGLLKTEDQKDRLKPSLADQIADAESKSLESRNNAGSPGDDFGDR